MHFVAFIELEEIKYGSIEGKRLYLMAKTSIVIFVLTMVIFFCKEVTVNLNATDFFIMAFGIYLGFNSFIKTGVVINLEIVTWISCIIAYFIAKQILANNKFTKSLSLFISIGLLAVLLQGVIGLLQLYGFETGNHQTAGVTGSFFNPAPYAGYLVSLVALSLSLYYSKQQIPDLLRHLSLVTFLVVALVLPVIWSWSAWLAGALGCFSLLFLNFKKWGVHKFLFSTKGKRIFTISFLIVTISISLFGLYHLKKDSTLGRILIWKISTSIFLDYPISGVGFGQYRPTFGVYQAKYFESGLGTAAESMVAGKGEFAFNEPIRLATEQEFLSPVPACPSLRKIGGKNEGYRNGKQAVEQKNKNTC